MLNRLESYFPGSWIILFFLVIMPLKMVPWVFEGDLWLVIIKVIFLFLPILLILVGFYCSVVSFLTFFFRANRIDFIATVLITWWDAGKAILTFWGGFFKFLFLLFGLSVNALKIITIGLFYLTKELVSFPFNLTRKALKNYLAPGVPWLAVFITLFWILLESFIFSYILTPMVIEIISQLGDVEPPRVIVTVVLFMFLFLFIGGSFACMAGLVESLAKKQIAKMLEMLGLEIIIMLFEVLFLYREFVDSLAPWLAQMTGESVQLGLGSILVIASFAWLGVRTSTWFFFAKYGTPTLLRIISREGIQSKSASSSSSNAHAHWSKQIVDNLKKETNWFAQMSNDLLEAFILPPAQILAVMTNFTMVLLTTKNLFNMPLKSIKEIKDTKALIDEISNKKGK